MVKQNQHMMALQKISGIGPITCTALVTTATVVCWFVDSDRQLAAWLGLTPRQANTRRKIRQRGISKRGDTYVRTRLMHGAKTIITKSKHMSWIVDLLARRPYCVVVPALANKLAATA